MPTSSTSARTRGSTTNFLPVLFATAAMSCVTGTPPACATRLVSALELASIEGCASAHAVRHIVTHANIEVFIELSCVESRLGAERRECPVQRLLVLGARQADESLWRSSRQQRHRSESAHAAHLLET